MIDEPETLGRYEILQGLGHGGFGTVYKAWDPVLEIEIALKVLDPHLASRDPTLVQGSLREARVAVGLHHPHIVRIYDVGEAEDTFHIAMHYLPGPSLADVTGREVPMSVARTMELLHPVAEALDYAHARDLVHRDVKPANIIFDEEGRFVLVDFGLVRATEGTSYVSLSGRVVGTVQCAAPEQLSALRAEEEGPATDVHALGIVAYQMLTRQVPFDGDTTAVIGSRLHDPPPSSRELN